MKRTMLALGLVLASTTYAGAWGWSDSIDAREANQARRIEQGRRDGSLTRSEYRWLEREQQQIRGMERRARADGYISPQERYDIRRAQDAASRHIYHERHDAERRWWRWW
jgi:hypothetical protein